jgi:hypothetical protein
LPVFPICSSKNTLHARYAAITQTGKKRIFAVALSELQREGVLSVTKKFSTLRAELSPQSRNKSDALARTILNEMPLYELRHTLDLSQLKILDKFPEGDERITDVSFIKEVDPKK